MFIKETFFFWIDVGIFFFFFFFIQFIIYSFLVLAVLGLHCCCGLFLRGCSLVVVRGLLISMQWHFLLWSTGFRSMGFSSWGTWAYLLQLPGSRALVQQLWCTGLVALRHVGSSWTRYLLNLCLLHWQADSFPLGHQGSPVLESLMKYFLISLPRKPGSFIVFFFPLCLLHYFLPEGLMSLLREMGKGYLALCSYNCKEAINILSHLPSHHYNTGWVLCQIGRAYFELSEYMQVSI